jgi:glycosyltransferase involved in cell wall biosynthesis
VWRRADGYVTITAALAADLGARFGDRERLSIVPDGVRLHDRDSGLAARGSRSDDRDSGLGSAEPIVAYAGHLYAWKGVDVLLGALALVPNARGLIVGGHAAEPDLPRASALAERLGIGQRVTFTGMVAPGRVHALLRSATILVLPNPASAISNRFTSPLKLFEYMAAGRAIVASDLPSIREVLRNDIEALLVPPGDGVALAAAIRRLIAEPGTAERLGRAAADAAPAYSWGRRAERLEALFTDVIGSNR